MYTCTVEETQVVTVTGNSKAMQRIGE